MAKYTQEKIEEIICNGSARTKARLYLRDRVALLPEGTEYIMRIGGPERLLSSVRIEDRSEFDRIVSRGLRIEAGIINLYFVIAEYRLRQTELTEAIRHRANLNNGEDLINSVLMRATDPLSPFVPPLRSSGERNLFDQDLPDDPEDTQEKRIEERRKLLTNPLSVISFLCTPQEITDQGYLRIRTDGHRIEDLSVINGRIKSLRSDLRTLYEVYIYRERATKRFIRDSQNFPPIPEYGEILKKYYDLLIQEAGPALPSNGGPDNRVPALRDLLRQEDDRIPDEIEVSDDMGYYKTL